MNRRDRQGARTPADLERRYNFEKRFDEAHKAVEDLDHKLNQGEVFDRLTNGGKSQGLFIGEDGQVYINASYLVTGVLQSKDKRTFYLDLVNGILKGEFTEFSIAGKSVGDIAEDTLNSQTQEEAFNKLTNNGNSKGIFYQDGELYINASYIVGAAPVGILQSVYPVGAVYISTVATNPATLFGFGTWVQIKDRFLLAAGDSHAAGTTGGAEKHNHKYGLQYGSYYRDISLELNSNAGLLNYDANGNASLTGGVDIGKKDATVNSGSDAGSKTVNISHFKVEANTSTADNMPPYLSVYVWQRTA